MAQVKYNAPYRRIDARVDIAYGDEYFRDQSLGDIVKLDISQENKEISESESLYAGGNAPKLPIMTLEAVKADVGITENIDSEFCLGKERALIDPFTAGWWSDAWSGKTPDGNGGYLFPLSKIPYAKVTFNDGGHIGDYTRGAKSMRSWQLLGAGVMDEYPREIELVLRDTADEELYRGDFLCGGAEIKINLLDGGNADNLNARAAVKDGYIQGVKSVETYIKSWSKPDRMAKLFYCFDNMTEEYGTDVLKDISIVHEKVNASEIKYGLCSDTCSVTILNSGRKFDRGYLKDQMQIRKRLIPYIDGKPQGTFYVKEWDISQDDLFIKCHASDRLLDLQNMEYERLPESAAETTTAYKLFEDILGFAAGFFVKKLAVSIDERLKSVVIQFPYVKRTKAWNALQSLCEATLSHLYIDLDERIVVKSDLLEYEENERLDPHVKHGIAVFRYGVGVDTGNAFGISIPFFADMAVTRAEVKYYTPTVKYNEKLKTIEKVDTEENGAVVSFKLGDLDFWAVSETGKPDETGTVQTGHIRFLKDDDSDGNESDVDCTPEWQGGKEWTLTIGKPFKGKIEIYGYKVELEEGVCMEQAKDMTDRTAELNAYIHPASDLMRWNMGGSANTAAEKSYVERIADYLLVNFGAKTKCAAANWRGDPNVLPEKQYSLTDRFGDNAVFECSYNKTMLDGGLKQDTKGVWKFDCQCLL
ncbi:MAG: hypothetical protein LBL66_03965 [Clostridiales bacterium]|nr:hypothetical protein [Clostridiales bacterium]